MSPFPRQANDHENLSLLLKRPELFNPSFGIQADRFCFNALVRSSKYKAPPTLGYLDVNTRIAEAIFLLINNWLLLNIKAGFCFCTVRSSTLEHFRFFFSPS